MGREDMARHKPDPAGLLLALEHLALLAAEVLHVGDHPIDAEAASRAGVLFIALLTGTVEVANFASYPVHSFLVDFSHLPSKLQMFG